MLLETYEMVYNERQTTDEHERTHFHIKFWSNVLWPDNIGTEY